MGGITMHDPMVIIVFGGLLFILVIGFFMCLKLNGFL